MIEMHNESDDALSAKRRDKMEELIASMFEGNAAEFARNIGRSDAQVSQWRAGLRNISTKTAMLIERKCGLPDGAMVDPREPNVGPFELLIEDLADEGAQLTLNFLQFQVNNNATQLGTEKTAHYLRWNDKIIEDMKHKRGEK